MFVALLCPSAVHIAALALTMPSFWLKVSTEYDNNQYLLFFYRFCRTRQGWSHRISWKNRIKTQFSRCVNHISQLLNLFDYWSWLNLWPYDDIGVHKICACQSGHSNNFFPLFFSHHCASFAFVYLTFTINGIVVLLSPSSLLVTVLLGFPGSDHQREIMKRRKNTASPYLTSGRKPTRWSLLSAWYHACATTSTATSTPTSNPCCRGTL